MKHSKLFLVALVGLAVLAGCGDDNATQVVIPQDDAPPLPPVGLDTALYGDGFTAVVRWEPNVEPDLAGYNVYRYDPAPTRPDAYSKDNPELVATAEYTLAIGIDDTVWIIVTAVDAAGHESAAAGPLEVRWQAPPSSSGGGKPPTPVEQDPDADGGGGDAPSLPQLPDDQPGKEESTTPGDSGGAL